MSLKVEYNIDEEIGIISRSFCGDVTLKNNLESWNELFTKHNLENIKGVINDFSQANMLMKIDEINTLLNYVNDNLINLPNIKLAVISDKPEIIVFPSIAANDFPSLKIRPFSTMEAARFWILEG